MPALTEWAVGRLPERGEDRSMMLSLHALEKSGVSWESPATPEDDDDGEKESAIPPKEMGISQIRSPPRRIYVAQ